VPESDRRLGSSLFLHRVRDVVARAAVTCSPDESAREIARRLTREGVGSVVVTSGEHGAVGIVTDRDLRRKIVAEGRDAAATPARAIMSAPVVTIAPGAYAWQAVLEMTRREIHHLVVLDDGRLAGVVSSNDFVVPRATHPVTLAGEIARAPSLPPLAQLADRVTALVRRLVDEGGRASDIGEIVAELNDRIVTRVLGLAVTTLEASAGPAPVGWAWLAFGSEARREQTLRTDQDNGLVYADPPPDRPEAAAWCARLASEAVEGLVAVGFPRCPGDIMASNPRWCRPLSAWHEQFLGWMRVPAPGPVLAASIFFDVRAVAGEVALGSKLRGVLQAEAPRQRSFLRFLAHDVVSRRVPLTLLGGLAVGRRGAERGRIDVKAAGTLQVVGAARLCALELGVGETNTVARLQAAATAGRLPEPEAAELIEAYRHLLRLRLVHQLGQLERAERPDNLIDPRALGRTDRLLLIEALKTVARLQAGLRDRYATDLIGT
jgi:CBS domain-containing protein